MALSEFFHGATAGEDLALKDDLDQLMRWAKRDGGKTVGAHRFASYLRIGLAAAAVTVVMMAGAPLEWTLVIAVVGVGLAVVRTVNDWQAQSYILLLYVSDQALHLHQEKRRSSDLAARQLSQRIDRALRAGRRRPGGGTVGGEIDE